MMNDISIKLRFNFFNILYDAELTAEIKGSSLTNTWIVGFFLEKNPNEILLFLNISII